MSGVIKGLVMQANAAQGDVPSEHEVLLLLSEQARCGSRLAQFDELAARRTAT